jgi:hypothetical protein
MVRVCILEINSLFGFREKSARAQLAAASTLIP